MLCHGIEVEAWKPKRDRILAAAFPDIRDGLNAHRWGKLYPFLSIRDRLCWVLSNEHGRGLYIHEAIRRSAVMGWAPPLRVLIHTPFNSILLCGKHHGTATEPSLHEIADWMFQTYGLQYLQWLQSLPFLAGTHPLKGFLEYHAA